VQESAPSEVLPTEEAPEAPESTETAVIEPAEEPAVAAPTGIDAPVEREDPAGQVPTEAPAGTDQTVDPVVGEEGDQADQGEGSAPEVPDFMGDPSSEGGIPVSPEQPTGTDDPANAPDPVEEELAELAPTVAVDAAASWTSMAFVADGTAAISPETNFSRADVIALAEEILAETEGVFEDETPRDAVVGLLEGLLAAGTEVEILERSEALGVAVSELRWQTRMANADTAMREASADARAALARGRAYDPAHRLDFGMAGWAHPVPSGSFTSGYGHRGYVAGAYGFHNGIDLAAPAGTPVRVAADGVVTYVGYGHSSRGLTGWTVIVSHGDGLETGYNHMYSSGVLVSEGQAVRAGDVIAEVGSTGRSTGPHLHLTVWQNGEHQNPRAFFSNRGVRF
ncbi:MAG: peptidoglycan DD-metalloendopeptidase family protein, partial [bacterium]|nr:peptidoglycan DD-metalloendopeptidase family protein [bacterium]